MKQNNMNIIQRVATMFRTIQAPLPLGRGWGWVLGLLLLASCSDVDYPDAPQVAGVSNLQSSLSGVHNRDLKLTWSLPQGNVEAVKVFRGQSEVAQLAATATAYNESKVLVDSTMYYAVKVAYEGGLMSEGAVQTVRVARPAESEIPGVSNLVKNLQKRNLTLTWNAPTAQGLEGIAVFCNGSLVSNLNSTATQYVEEGILSGTDLTYEVKADYGNQLYSVAATTTARYDRTTKMAYMLPSNTATVATLNKYEKQAAEWFLADLADFGALVKPAELATLDPKVYTVLWINLGLTDGTPQGWTNLGDLGTSEFATALRNYVAKGGNLLLSGQATQLVVPAGIMPEGFGPSMYGAGGEANGGDDWYLNAQIGCMNRDADPSQYYDHMGHPLFKGLQTNETFYDDHVGVYLTCPGLRTDNNNMWDLNAGQYGLAGDPEVGFAAGSKNVVEAWEKKTNSTVLATWGQVVDYCCAGIIDFEPRQAGHGRCVAIGLAAYQWYQNDGNNAYQKNIEGLTRNALNYLEP